MTIRRAEAADLETVRELWEAFYAEWPEPPHRQKGWDDIAEEVRVAIGESVVLLAEERGAAVGYALAFRHPRNERIGFLADLYVRPAFRLRGIGRALLGEAATALSREYLTLSTEVRNKPARAYYKRLGFDEESVNLVIEMERLA
jgi:ribosomal protein S18 acetylase RimI-like enzyme